MNPTFSVLDMMLISVNGDSVIYKSVYKSVYKNLYKSVILDAALRSSRGFQSNFVIMEETSFCGLACMGPILKHSISVLDALGFHYGSLDTSDR